MCVRGSRFFSLLYSIRATTLSCSGAFCPMPEQVGAGRRVLGRCHSHSKRFGLEWAGRERQTESVDRYGEPVSQQ